MKLEQNIGWGARENFFLFEDKVRVESVRWLRRAEYALNYYEMHENPVRTKHVSLGSYLVGGLLLAGSLLGLAAAMLAPGAETAIIGWTAFIIMGVLGLAMIIVARRKSFDVVAFRGMAGNCVLHANRPDPEEFSTFIVELQRRIADSRNIERRTVAGVLDVLHRQGIIDDWQHQQLKTQFQLIP